MNFLKIIIKFIFFTFIFLLPFSSESQTLPEATVLFNKMLDAMDDVKTSSFNLFVGEMINGNLEENKYIVKLQSSPFKTYVYCVKPNPGSEALFVEGTNNNKILINPNRFPYFNISLGENNLLIRKNHPYSITEMGFTYIQPLLRSYVAKEGPAFNKRLSCSKEISWNKKQYYLLEINNPDFTYINYTLKKNETVTELASRFLINDRMILIKNKNLHNYETVKAGTELILPNSFARRIEFYIDKKSMLPMVQIVYDEKGLYSRIEFTSFLLNPVFKQEEFTSDFSEYHF